MKMENFSRRGSTFNPSSSPFSMTILLVLFPVLMASISASPSGPVSSFSPKDNFLLDCGAKTLTTLPDGRIFQTEQQSSSFLSTSPEDKEKNLQFSVPSSSDKVPSPIYLSARGFLKEATYSFKMSHPGWHWVRLHFYPVSDSVFSLQDAKFNVTTDDLTLVHDINFDDGPKWVLKEFLVNITTERFSIHFSPQKDKIAFVNGIEVVSAPDNLISEDGTSLFPVANFPGLSNYAYQTVYRINMGGPLITSQNDTLGRTWTSDEPYLKHGSMAKKASVAPSVITYPTEGGVTPLIAPQSVYASAIQMADARTVNPKFNVTWEFDVDTGFGYVLRMHFCDIVSKSLNDLYFNVFVNGKMAISGLDLSSLTSDLATPYYKDVVVNATLISEQKLTIQIGALNEETGSKNAIINGLEVLKMSNSVNSLDGEFGPKGQTVETSYKNKTVAAVGFAMMFGAFVGLGAMVIKWHKRPQDWQRRNSFSSWLLPLHAGDTSFMTSKHSMGSHKSGFYSSTMLGRYFSFAELQEATKNFDPNAIVGVGGFGNVYLGEIDDGTKVAVKRGNPQSEQGITEFQTEIQLLSKLRHRHLVSLIGYCDENSEMILVYEYMSNGPFRDHLYGKDGMAPLSWKQRLEICIGAARGLHYLHTGSAEGIIHRDVKTTNILLDENFVAKVADFGLSKCGPTMEQTHVSTAVKGSFGYLDPEYFRRQQLTDKSDVYSFGVVLLEALCARPALNPALPREQVSLAEWAMQWKRKGLLEKIMDPLLVNVINPESMKKFAEAAEKCLAEYGVDRPTMGDVLWNLEYALQLQEAFVQGKAEETPSDVVATPPANVVQLTEENKSPVAQVPVNSEQHSAVVMDTQLNGR